MPEGNEDHRRSPTHHVPPPGGLDWAEAHEEADSTPSGVMWPEAGAGFDPSSYSPAGAIQGGALIASKLHRDPGGVWRTLRGSWGLWILLGGILIVVAAAVVGSLV